VTLEKIEGVRPGDDSGPPPLSIPEPGWSTVFAWLMRRVLRFQVHGRSMLPTLQPGDTIWVDRRAFRDHPVRVGDLVMARHPFRRDQRMVKRVSQVCGDGKLELVGDNPLESTDSRGLGLFDPLDVLGKVCAHSPRGD